MPVVAFWLLAGCVDNKLQPLRPRADAASAEAEAWVVVPPADASADTAPEDSGAETWPDTCDLAPSPTESARGDPTCQPLDDGWNGIVVERSWKNSEGEEGSSFLGAPVVLPDPGASVATIAMQTVVGVAPWPIVGVGGATALPAFWSEGVGGDADRLASTAVPGPDGAPVDSWYGVGWTHESLGLGTGCATSTGGFVGSLETFTHGDPLVLDVDHDAMPEVFSDRVLADSACTPLYAHDDAHLSIAHGAAIGSGGQLLIATGEGILRADDHALTPWRGMGRIPSDAMWTTGIVPLAGGPHFVVSTAERVHVLDESGSVLWWLPDESAGLLVVPPAAGDLDGDGVPELVMALQASGGVYDTVAVAADGSELWRVTDPLDAEGTAWTAGLTLADLDADGRYEVVTWGSTGLFIRDGATGAVQASETSIATRAFWTYPLVADVDADGSAEIVVAGQLAEGLWDEATNNHLYFLGPAEGRWARTRPVWNQTSYDATTIRDDGVLVRFPRPAWQDYHAWRAQPAHDGDKPDLVPRVGDACATTCANGGVVEVEVIVENLGSLEAPAGTEVVLSTWTEGDIGLAEVARATIAAPIPSMTAAEGIVFSVPWERWNDARVIDVYGAGYEDGTHEECDFINDRIDVWVDPCAE